jgi:methylated-DNA-[protein]-cysteine S-methyltransferase
MTRFIDHLETPVGELAIVVEHDRLVAVGFTEEHRRMKELVDETLVPKKNPGGFTALLKRYFAGDLHAIDDLPVAFSGTPFQLAVWQTLRKIPCGETWSYADVARKIGRPKAVRAVGMANGMNPVGVVVPCHRVIGSNGTLTGYGGGIARKEWLLKHESGPTKGSRRRPATAALPLAQR